MKRLKYWWIRQTEVDSICELTVGESFPNPKLGDVIQIGMYNFKFEYVGKKLWRKLK